MVHIHKSTNLQIKQNQSFGFGKKFSAPELIPKCYIDFWSRMVHIHKSTNLQIEQNQSFGFGKKVSAPELIPKRYIDFCFQ